MSTELESPVVLLRDGRPAPPTLFRSVWERLAEASWRPLAFGVRRAHPAAAPCINPDQSIVTDTGPTLELVTSPAPSIAGIARQVDALRAETRAALDAFGCVMLGSGVHPGLRAVPADYYLYRTPRPAYDYAIRERSWRHWSIVNIAATQEIVDVSFDDAPRAIRALHRLAGLMNFILRNDPDLLGDYGGRLSVRPLAWRDHVPRAGPFAADAGKVVVPAREIASWRDYLSLLWEDGPMFLVGAKDGEAAYLPRHPTFIEFLRDCPRDGWPARTLSGEDTRVLPELAHAEHTDWTYLGFARIRWKWRSTSAAVDDLVSAWCSDAIEEFLEAHLEKVLIENRCNATQPPGESLVSLALVAGLLANLDEALVLALREPYSFWRSVLEASTTEPVETTVEGRFIPGYARDMLDVALEGLRGRGDEEGVGLLAPLYRRVEERSSPSEELLREYRRGGIGRLVDVARV